ncbi:MAG TPA: sugar phosphate isomerase/epimerase family protein [Bryobacteraceae bacterium]|nr:sugar phosphate isomerase/epimerase family protein [Bryobacteraceae bacterium]
MNRRDFLAAVASPLAAAPGERARPQLCIFSKHMAQFGYAELGRTAKQMGFDGIDLTVRAKGHVLPERAAEDLPKAADAIRSNGLNLPMITTGITSGQDPNARAILGTASKLKVPYWKPGYLNYALNDIESGIEKARKSAAELGALSREYGIAVGFHNHSGNYIGSAMWDTRWMIRDLDPKWVGYYFDPAHATVEGGLAGWRISEAMALPRLKMVAVKDFYWEKAGGTWKPKWCPLGEGMLNWTEVFKLLAAANFAGPISLHVEYDPKDELAAIAKDLQFLKDQVTKAWA